MAAHTAASNEETMGCGMNWSARFAVAVVATWGALLAVPASAADIDIEFLDMRPVEAPTIHVTLSGEIVSGDMIKLATELKKYNLDEMRNILVMFDSHGGDLFEGIKIGTLLRNLDGLIVSTQVGSIDSPNAICASACVLAYLGGGYRYLGSDGRIGVHRFSYSNDDVDVTPHEAMADAQETSAMIVNHIERSRADTRLFDRMSSTAAEGIDWIPEDVLREWRVVTGPIYDEIAEYVNINGGLALKLEQLSLFGENRIILTCGSKGLVVVARLNEPETTSVGHFEYTIDGVGYEPTDWEVLMRKDYKTHVASIIPPHLYPAIKNARTFGARVVIPAGTLFYGFEQTIRDTKLKDMIEGCVPSSVAAPTISKPPMTAYRDLDLVGHDLTDQGFRGVSFAQCKEICLQAPSCGAVSYVIEKQWCWPKASGAKTRAAPGILSAVRN